LNHFEIQNMYISMCEKDNFCSKRLKEFGGVLKSFQSAFDIIGDEKLNLKCGNGLFNKINLKKLLTILSSDKDLRKFISLKKLFKKIKKIKI
jgi:hypothetical protein